MRVAVVTAYFPPAHLAGGPIQTLAAMVLSAPEDIAVDVLTSDGDLGAPSSLKVPSASWTSWGAASVYYSSSEWKAVLKGYLALARRRPTYIYLNSFFGAQYSILAQALGWCGLFGRTHLVVAPRGELNPGALAIRARKKRAYLAVYRMLGLGGRVLWHASTELEARDIRREIGSRARIVVRNNDARLPEHAPHRSSRASGPCRLVFASRLTEKKRLDMLLAALQLVQGDFTLRVIGAFEGKPYAAKCRELISTLGLESRVELLGSGSRDDVLREFAAADAFVFPTAGENFGHVIAESLSVSCPIIASAHTPWNSYLEPGGKVVFEDTAEGFGRAIEEFLQLGPAGWLEASHSAANSFERWKHEASQPHLFDLLRDGAGECP